MKPVLTALACLLLASSCARHVVLDPSMVASQNDPDWRIRPQAVTATGASVVALPAPPH
jgi:hypothetical protein